MEARNSRCLRVVRGVRGGAEIVLTDANDGRMANGAHGGDAYVGSGVRDYLKGGEKGAGHSKVKCKAPPAAEQQPNSKGHFPTIPCPKFICPA